MTDGPVLCALDLQRHTEALIEAAMEWAASLQTSVELLHVKSPVVAIHGVPTELVGELGLYRTALETAGKRDEVELDRVASQVRARGLGCTSLRLEGNAGQTISARASELDASLIVLGPHASALPAHWLERASVGRRLLGGVVSRVLRTSTCPAWVGCGVELGTLPPASRRWVIGVDRPPTSAPWLKRVFHMSRSSRARPLLVHVVERLHDFEDPQTGLWNHLREEAERLLEQGLADDIDTEVHVGTPSEMLLEAAQQHSASLIVVGAGGRRGGWLGAHARRVLRRARVPVLVLPDL